MADFEYQGQGSSSKDVGGQFLPLLYVKQEIKSEPAIDPAVEMYLETNPLPISVWRNDGVAYDDVEFAQDSSSDNMFGINFRHASTQTDETTPWNARTKLLRLRIATVTTTSYMPYNDEIPVSFASYDEESSLSYIDRNEERPNSDLLKYGETLAWASTHTGEKQSSSFTSRIKETSTDKMSISENVLTLTESHIEATQTHTSDANSNEGHSRHNDVPGFDVKTTSESSNDKVDAQRNAKQVDENRDLPITKSKDNPREKRIPTLRIKPMPERKKKRIKPIKEVKTRTQPRRNCSAINVEYAARIEKGKSKVKKPKRASGTQNLDKPGASTDKGNEMKVCKLESISEDDQTQMDQDDTKGEIDPIDATSQSQVIPPSPQLMLNGIPVDLDRRNYMIFCTKCDKRIMHSSRWRITRTCPVCQTELEIREYEGVNTVDNPLKCRVCEQLFEYPNRRRRHELVHFGGGRPFECSQCNKRFARKSYLTMHMKMHLPDNPFCCQYCKKTFRCVGSLKKHLRIYTAESVYKCQQCPETFKSYCTLRQHRLIIHERRHIAKSYPCQFCERTFDSYGACKQHEKDDHDIKCRYCGKRFSFKSYLRYHEKTHERAPQTSKKMSHVCQYCGATFATMTAKDEHEHQQTASEKVQPCPICNAFLTSACAMSKHLKAHENTPSFKCCYCEETFVQECHVVDHIASQHPAETPFSCTLCKRLFARATALQSHVDKMHPAKQGVSLSDLETSGGAQGCGAQAGGAQSGGAQIGGAQSVGAQSGGAQTDGAHADGAQSGGAQGDGAQNSDIQSGGAQSAQIVQPRIIRGKPFVCSVCGRAFATRRGRKEHELRHTTPKPYSCSYCGKCFTARTSLKSHEMTHTGEKPYQCSYCGKRFGNNSVLKTHEVNHLQG